MHRTYGLKQVSRDAALPVSVATCKEHLRIIGTDVDDSYIEDLINEATDYIETILNRCYVNTVFDYTLDSFPYFNTERIQPVLWGRIGIWLPIAPVVSVDSVNYKDFTGTEVTFTDWTLNNYEEPASIVPTPQNVWPFADVQRSVPVRIRFTAGYGTDAIPPRARAAIKTMVSHLYENREATTEKTITTVPLSFESILRSLRYR